MCVISSLLASKTELCCFPPLDIAIIISRLKNPFRCHPALIDCTQSVSHPVSALHPVNYSKQIEKFSKHWIARLNWNDLQDFPSFVQNPGISKNPCIVATLSNSLETWSFLCQKHSNGHHHPILDHVARKRMWKMFGLKIEKFSPRKSFSVQIFCLNFSTIVRAIVGMYARFVSIAHT